MSWVLQTSPNSKGGRSYLPAVGGLTNTDCLFLLRSLWESRKQLSFIGAKAATPGWSFVIQILGESLFDDLKDGKREPVMWGFLETLCHRYGLVASNDEIEFVPEFCTVTGDMCSDKSTRHHVQSMEDEEDAQIVVESYIARMTPKPDIDPLPIFFCATLADFVFQERISHLGDLLVPLIKVGYERIWMGLAEEQTLREKQRYIDMAQCIINVLGSTERLFGAEHKFSFQQVESFIQALHDIDLVGFIGQAILLPAKLPTEPEVDACWARVIKTVIGYGQTLAYSRSSSFASKLFADSYLDWVNTSHYIQSQILNERSREKSLRGNAPGADLAWANFGNIFGFPRRMQEDKNPKGPLKAFFKGGCANPRCLGALDSTSVCGRCMDVEYCSRLCQNIHWKLASPNAHRRSCV